MTRPDVERIAAEMAAGAWEVQWTRELIAYIRALEAARDKVLPKEYTDGLQPCGGWKLTGRQREAFDAAVARWEGARHG